MSPMCGFGGASAPPFIEAFPISGDVSAVVLFGGASAPPFIEAPSVGVQKFVRIPVWRGICPALH